MTGTARTLDHAGNWTPEFPLPDDGIVTCRAADGRWDHKLFGSGGLHPGSNLWQAMTLCGRRALEIPGRSGAVNCPGCLECMAEPVP